MAMSYTAFSSFDHLASGSLAEVYAVSRDVPGALIFDEQTGRVVDIDPRYPPNEETVRPGRPRLGVVAREITLLPRHWDWLATQPGGASVALRKLVEQARRTNQGKDRLRLAQEATYRFMSTMAGNEPGFEEATRALFAGDQERFTKLVEPWPVDVGNHARKFAGRAFECLVGERTPETRPRYTLVELLAKCDFSQPLPPEDREWIDAPAVGRELL